METKEITQKLLDIVANETGIAIEEIELNAHFEEDLNVDDFELANLLAVVEDAFQINFDKDTIKKVNTVQDLVHLVEDSI